jgi:hypothetical protein
MNVTFTFSSTNALRFAYYNHNGRHTEVDIHVRLRAVAAATTATFTGRYGITQNRTPQHEFIIRRRPCNT